MSHQLTKNASSAEKPLGNSRATTSRAFLTREAILQNIGKMNNSSPLFEVYKRAPEGYVYGWLRESINSERDDANLFDMESKGWTPVPASRHPEFFFATKSTHHEHEHDTEALRHRGLRLYERLKEFDDYEKQMSYEAAIQEVKKNPGLSGDKNIMDMGYSYHSGRNTYKNH